MQRNDYQDALNELRLSSKFCEEMEKKLSAQVTEDDEYTDEVTHVEVVPQRNYRKLALAAAFVLAVCGAGGGALYMNREAFLDSSGTERTIYDEKEFTFPFGSVELHGTVFNYNCQGVITGGTTVADQEMGGELQALFASAEFREMEPNIVNSNFDGERISFNTQDFYADFYDDGLIVIEEYGEASSVNNVFSDTGCQQKYYKIDPAVFRKMKQILYKYEKFGIIDALGINAEIYDADITMGTRDNKLTDREAMMLAAAVNSINWKYSDTPPDTVSNENINIRFTYEAVSYDITFYSNGNAAVRTTRGSKTTTEFFSMADNPDGFIELKTCVDNGAPCESPFKYEKTETASANIYDTYRKQLGIYESNNNGYIIKDEDFKTLVDMLNGFNWRRSVGYNSVFSNDIAIATRSQRLSISSGGVCDYYNYEEPVEIGEYGIVRYYIDEDEYTELVNWLTSLGSKAADPNELAESSIDRLLSGESVNLRYAKYWSEGKTVDLFSSNGAQEISDALKSLDWKLTDEFLPCSSNCYELCCSNSGYSTLILSRDGLMVDQELMISFKCEEPEKYIEVIDKLFSKNETINRKYHELLPDDGSDS